MTFLDFRDCYLVRPMNSFNLYHFYSRKCDGSLGEFYICDNQHIITYATDKECHNAFEHERQTDFLASTRKNAYKAKSEGQCQSTTSNGKPQNSSVCFSAETSLSPLCPEDESPPPSPCDILPNQNIVRAGLKDFVNSFEERYLHLYGKGPGFDGDAVIAGEGDIDFSGKDNRDILDELPVIIPASCLEGYVYADDMTIAPKVIDSSEYITTDPVRQGSGSTGGGSYSSEFGQSFSDLIKTLEGRTAGKDAMSVEPAPLALESPAYADKNPNVDTRRSDYFGPEGIPAPVQSQVNRVETEIDAPSKAPQTTRIEPELVTPLHPDPRLAGPLPISLSVSSNNKVRLRGVGTDACAVSSPPSSDRSM